MATTTNNGWATPDDSDPFKQGALAIRTLGNNIDTSTGTGLLAWTSYTPTLSQGTSTNISKTVVYAKYAKLGKIVHANVRLQSTGTGQAGQAVVVTLPINAASFSIPGGNGGIFDASVNNYTGFIWIASATTCSLVSHMNSDSLVGVNPSFAIASGDFINLTLMYEGV
jgi:hypothetical protein